MHRHELKTRDGFWVVSLFWFVLCFFAAIPLMLANNLHESLTDAMFETVSGFTTTGATVLTGLDQLPHAILYYRQQLQFLGGMGIIVLAVAILPMLGIGGMQLYRAEAPGPTKDNKLTPRITETAKTLWYIYVGIAVLCTLAFLGSRDGFVRCRWSQFCDSCHRWFLNTRCEFLRITTVMYLTLWRPFLCSLVA